MLFVISRYIFYFLFSYVLGDDYLLKELYEEVEEYSVLGTFPYCPAQESHDPE